MISLVIKDKVCVIPPTASKALSYVGHPILQLYIGEATVGTVFGVIIGPHVSNIFDPTTWGSNPVEKNRITLEFMRVVLATGLFAIGVELPKAYLAEHARSLLIMVERSAQSISDMAVLLIYFWC